MNNQSPSPFHRGEQDVSSNQNGLPDPYSPVSSLGYPDREEPALIVGRYDQINELRHGTSQPAGSPNTTRPRTTSSQEHVQSDERGAGYPPSTETSFSTENDNDQRVDPRTGVSGCNAEALSDSIDSTAKEASRPWTPFFLQVSTLVCFPLAFTALLVALIALGIVDDKNQGLVNSIASRHYLWTYGPTAVISIIAAFWTQVEYRAKQMMPWEILRRGPSSAADTLLLDYIDPPRFVSLFYSLKNGHYPVSLATAGTFLLQLLTVVSTGLLVLQTERVKHPDVGLLSFDEFNLNPSGLVAAESTPMLSAIALNQGNLTFPAGTSYQLAFPTLRIDDELKDAQNLSIATITDIFHASLGCEIFTGARWSDQCLEPDEDCTITQVMVSFDTPSCHVENRSIGTMDARSPPGMFGFSAPAYCGDSFSDFRFVIAMATYTLEAANRNTSVPQTSRGLQIEESSVLICKPQYSIVPGAIVIDNNGVLLDNNTLPPSSSKNPYQLPTSQKRFLDSFLKSASYTDHTIRADRDWDFYDRTMDYRDEFFTVLTAFVNPKDMTSLFPSETLLSQSETFYSMASAQLAKEHLMVGSSKKANGTVFADEQRLRVRTLSLYLMDAILALLMIATTALCFLAPRNNTSHDPGSVGGMALAMAESPSLCEPLSGHGTTGIFGLQPLLTRYRALSSIKMHDSKQEFQVVLYPSDSEQRSRETDERPVKQELSWWNPLSISRVTKVCVTLFLLLIIAALESLYQASEDHDGLADVDTKGYVHYTWSYIPALTMFTAALLVGMIGESSKIFFPYHELRRKLGCTTQQLFNSHLSKVTVHSICSSVASKEFAMLATGLSMLLTPLLTIVASGLYSPQNTKASQDVTLGYVNTFNLSQLPEIQTESSYTLSLILRSNLSYPAWTHGEFAFPEVSLETIRRTGEDISSSYSDFNGSSVRVTVPAIRASLPCSYFEPGTVHTERVPRLEAWIAETPDGGECSMITSEHKLNDSVPFGWMDWYTCPGRPHGVYGAALDNDSAQGVRCSPSIQQVMVDLTLGLPDYDILSAHPDESTAQAFAIAGWNWQNFDLNRVLPIGPYANTTGGATDLDPTFQALLQQAGEGDIAALQGEQNFPRVARILERIFRLAFVQVAHLHFRVPAAAAATASPEDPSSSLNGTLVTSHTRLKQSAISTRILEGLLAAIALCLVASSWLLDPRKVLPKNPCSIAAAASLLAGAEMLRPGAVPAGAVWCPTADLVKRRIFGGGDSFSMGFWGERRNDSGVVATGDGAGEGTEKAEGMRFGIDRGKADWE